MPYSVPDLLLPLLLFVVAALYSSVGHGGASGYLAVMALLGMAPETMKPTALLLNILVSGMAFYQFARHGHFRPALLWPCMLTAVPLAYFGGAATLAGEWYRPIVGAVLLYAAVTLVVRPPQQTKQAEPRPLLMLLIGAVLGYLSGLVGVGGGIFLSPLMLMLGWGTAQQVSAVAAGFILLNSAAGLLGHLGSVQALPPQLPLWAWAALAGGTLGSFLGSTRLPRRAILGLLSAALVMAGFKMLLT